MLGFFGILVLALILIWRSLLDWILRSFNCEGGFYFYCCSCFGYENSILAPQIPLTPILFFHLAMRTIARNCRGAGRASTIRALKELIRESNPDIVFLSETKIKSMRINKICDRLKFVDSWCVDADGLSGGLALFWRLGVELKVVFSNKNMIVAVVYSDPPEAPWLLFAIYGPIQRSKKEKFWGLLENMVSTFSGPCVVIGDLNCIKRAKEKRGGCAVVESSVCYLKDFMSNTGAIDLGFLGPSFTWSNRREGLANIKERLDQCLCDQEWQSLFPKAGVRHLCKL